MQPSFPESLVPAIKLAAVQKALRQTFNTKEITEAKSLTGGLSASLVYKLTIDGQAYALKLDASPKSPDNTAGPDKASASNTTAGALICMKIAADADIAPPLYYLDTEDSLSITGFIESKPLRAVFSSPEILVTALAKTIRSVHELPLFPTKSSMLDTIEGLIGEVKESPLFTTAIFADFFEYYDTIRQHYPWQDADKVPSHNDLNPGNILCDGKKIWIIDWDAAFQNDRYVDLAMTSIFFVTGEAQEQQFLQTYFGGTLNAYHNARFFIMRQICRLIYALLTFKLAYAANPLCPTDDPALQTATLREIGPQIGSGQLSLSSYKGQLLYGKALLNDALNDVRSPRFVLSIGLLSGELLSSELLSGGLSSSD